MNILRHKKWHVRTKENVARVRRDEAKAAEEERARAERAALAEHEDRVRRLKARASVASSVASVSDIFGTGDSAPTASSSTATTTKKMMAQAAATTESAKHVNLFAELEEQERTNTVVGNREYAAERKKEQDDWESKVGIMKRFAEDTKEYAKESEWWEGIPLVRERVDKKRRSDDAGGDKASTKDKTAKFMTEEEKRALKKERKKKEAKKKKKSREKERKTKKKRKRRHASSSSASTSSSSDSEAERKRAKQLDELRRERAVRERQEQAKVQQLFAKPEPQPADGGGAAAVKSQADEDRQRRYNSQFNPALARS